MRRFLVTIRVVSQFSPTRLRMVEIDTTGGFDEAGRKAADKCRPTYGGVTVMNVEWQGWSPVTYMGETEAGRDHEGNRTIV
jgi:hypothetical protein